MDMKKTFKFFAAALAIVAAASCAKESTDNSVNSEVETVPVILTASYDAQTKTLLGADNWVNWSDNDAIRVAYADSYGDVYLHDGIFTIDPSSNDNDPTFAAFSGNLPTNKAKKFSAIFPGQGWEGTSDGVRFSGLATQQAVVGSFDPAKHIAISEVTKGTHFTFQNACSLLKVTIGSDGVYSIKVDGTSNEIGIGKPFQYKLGTMDILKFQDWAGYDASITLSNTDSTPLLNGGTYYIVVPHVTVKNFKVSLCDASGSVLYSQSKKSDFAIVRNKIYDLGTMTVPEGPEGPGGSGDASIPEGATYIYSDGTGGTDPNPSGKTVIAVVIYNGNPKELMNDTMLPDEYCHGLAISTTSRQCAWHSTQLSSSSIPSSLKYTTTSTIKDFSKGGYTTMQEYAGTSYVVYDNGEAPSNTSGWYLGTPMEWNYILKNKDQINDLLSSVGGDIIDPQGKSTSFWLPLFYGSKPVVVYLSAGQPYYYYEDWYYIPQNTTYCHYARPIFAF